MVSGVSGKGTDISALSGLRNLPATGDDHVVPFTVETLDARGRVIKLGAVLESILNRHAYPDPVAQLLAEVMVLTVLLGSAFKANGKFIIQTRSDGPVNLLVCDFSHPADLRAYARFDAQAVAAAIDASTTSPQELLGKGTLALTIVSSANAQPYQGIVALDGTDLATIARSYFTQSEQIPTAITLAVAPVYTRDVSGKQRKSWRAGGYLAQFLPGASDENQQPASDNNRWREVEALSSTIEALELTDPDLSAEHLLYRLFHQQGVRVFSPAPVIDRCSCSREKIHTVLAGFSAEELSSTIENGKITVSCEFCSTNYHFNPQIFSSP